MSENLCEGPHIFTEQGLIRLKRGAAWRRLVDVDAQYAHTVI